MLMLLEEIKTQGQTQILLLQQLLSASQSGFRGPEADTQEDYGLPFSSVEQLKKMDMDCGDRDIKAKLVGMA